MTLLLTLARDHSGADSPILALALLALAVWLAGYLIACAVWPFGTCRRCHGQRVRSPSGKYWRNCRKCHGSGRRIRLGRRVWDRIRPDPDDR